MKTSQKTLMIFFALIILFSLASCVPTDISEIRIHEGTDGLIIDFMERSPPDEVYVDDPFPLTVEIHNNGAYDIKDGVLVFGIEEGYVFSPSEEINELVKFDLTGRSSYDPLGGYYRKTLPLTAGSLDPQSETHTTLVSVTACYPYRTQATAIVCIDPDIYGQRTGEKVCTPQDLSMGIIKRQGQELPRGQGAPIAITYVEQRMLAHKNEELIKPQFLIHIENMGNGIPVDLKDYDKACMAGGLSSRAWNVLRANVYLSDRTVQLNCSPKLGSGSADRSSYIKLEEGEDAIKCELTGGIQKSMGTFTTPLMVDIDYGYTFTVSKNVLIRKQV